jgi:hypothetical protein
MRHVVPLQPSGGRGVTDRSRRAYLGLARLFLVVGSAVGLVGALDALLGLELFRGSPVGTALFLLVIGGLLHWTATTAPRRSDDEADGGERVASDD